MDSKIIPFSQSWESPDYDELQAMDAQELEQCLAQVRAQIQALDAREPADMESEEYDQWGQLHEELEDIQDEILDLLDKC